MIAFSVGFFAIALDLQVGVQSVPLIVSEAAHGLPQLADQAANAA